MAEETLKYRVELDPNQVNSQLAQIRSAVGGALSNSLGGAFSPMSGGVTADLERYRQAPSAVAPLVNPAMSQSSFAEFRHRFSAGIGSLSTMTMNSASSVAGGIGYGMELSRGAVNSISEDMHSARARMSGFYVPSVKQATRGLVEGGLEAGFGAAQVAIPATIFSAGMFGAANTATGLATGAGLIAGGAGLLGRAAVTGLGLGVGAGAMAASALATPLGSTLVASYAAGKAVNFVGERMIEDFRASNIIEDAFISRGMNSRDAARSAGQAVYQGRKSMIGGAELTGVMEQGLDLGLLGTKGSNPDNMGKELVEIAKTAKAMAAALKSNIASAMQHMSELKQSGLGQGDMIQATIEAQAAGSATFMGTSAMLSASGMGSQMAKQFSIDGRTGSSIGMSSIGMAQSGIAGLSSGQQGAIGGVGGLSQTMARTRIGLMSSNYVRSILSGGDIDKFGRGETNVTDMYQKGAIDLAAAGPTGQAEYLLNLDKRQSEMTAGDQRMVELGTIAQMSRSYGLDVNNKADRASLALGYGKLSGLDITTATGRAQAQAAMDGMLDPTVGARESIELGNRATQIREENYGLFNALVANPLTSITGGASNLVGSGFQYAYSGYVRARETVGSAFTGLGRGARSLFRSPGAAEGSWMGDLGIRRAYEESYSFDMPAFNDMSREALDASIKSSAKAKGMTVKEYKDEIWAGPTGISGKAASDYAKIKGIFDEEIDLSKETEAFQDEVSAVDKYMNREGVAAQLEGLTQTELLTSVTVGMSDAGLDPTSNRAIASAANTFLGSVKQGKLLDLSQQELKKRGAAATSLSREKIAGYSEKMVARYSEKSMMDYHPIGALFNVLFGGSSTRDILGELDVMGEDKTSGIMSINAMLGAGSAKEFGTLASKLRTNMGNTEAYGKVIKKVRSAWKDGGADLLNLKEDFGDMSSSIEERAILAARLGGGDGDRAKQTTTGSAVDVNSELGGQSTEANREVFKQIISRFEQLKGQNEALLNLINKSGNSTAKTSSSSYGGSPAFGGGN